MIIWLTGLSGAGKSTISNELYKNLKPSMSSLVLIDGDVVRELFGNDLGYDIDSRKLQIIRIQKLTRFLSQQGIPVIVSALYSDPELFAWNRLNLKEYYEIYVDAPIDVVIQRDVKGIYQRAKAGELLNIVGVDIPWNCPQSPDLILETNKLSLEESIQLIFDSLPMLGTYDVKKNTR
jgi:adenylyl-sulfate kinase